MPVSARLSKLLYDRLGEQLADELVDWFDQVDLTYRTELKELNEMNFTRFDARLEQRLSQVEARLDTQFNKGLADVRVEVAEAKTSLVWWMFGFWSATTVATVGLVLAILKAFP
ncbi:MAG: hypothetical protein ACT4PM_07665 [Gemmatimonadales bacterium]